MPQFFVRCTKFHRALGLAVLSALLWAHPAWAATRTVDTTDDNAGLTTCSAAANDCSLRGALSGASANDTINFDPSLANQTITLTGGELVIVQPVTINGQGALPVTVSGNFASRVISTSASLTVNSVLIRDGQEVEGDGGGIFAQSDLTLIGTVIRNNRASSNGGGVFVRGNMLSTGSSFISNTAALFGGGGAYVVGNATITQSNFDKNKADTGGGGLVVGGLTNMSVTEFLNNVANGIGGGAYLGNGANITGTNFVSNTAGSGGGGAYLGDGANITGTSFVNNTAGTDGGGARIDGVASIAKSSFLYNSATDAGGGLYLHGDQPALTTVINSLFADNHSLNNVGDALHTFGFNSANNLLLLHNTFANTTAEKGTSISLPRGIVTVTNSIIANHVIAISRSEATVSEDYNLYSDILFPFSGVVMTGSHSIIGAAAFVDPSLDDYHLTSLSAAVNAGVEAGVNDDFDSAIRPQANAPDMGAFESPYGLPTIDIGDANVVEGNSGTVMAFFALTLSNPSALTVTVDLAIVDGTAFADGDYNGGSAVLRITPGITNVTIIVTINGDPVVEADERFTLELSNPVGASLGDAVGEGVILNDDETVISIGDGSVLEGNNGLSELGFPITLSNPSAFTVTAEMVTVDGSAHAGSDYIGGVAVLVIAPGVTNETVYVNVHGDTLAESDEHLTLELSKLEGASPGDAVGEGVILNDDGAVVSINPASVTEGNSGISSLVFTVTLSNPVAQAITLTYFSNSDDAVAGSDFLSVNDLLVLEAGATSTTITVPVVGDLMVEANETLSVTLDGLNGEVPAGVILPEGGIIVTGTILNDDSAIVALGDASVLEGNSGNSSLVFTVTLSNPVAEVVGFYVVSFADTATVGDDYVALGEEVVLDAGVTSKTFTVTVKGDLLVEADETLYVSLIRRNGAFPTGVILPIGGIAAIGTILNDDVPPNLHLVVTADPAAGTQVGTGARITYFVTLSNTGGIASNLVISALLPSHVALVEGSVTPPTSTVRADIVAAEASGRQAGTVLQWSIPSLASGGMFQATFAVTVQDAIEVQLQIYGSASGVSSTPVTISHVIVPTNLDEDEEPKGLKKLYLPLVGR